MNSENDESQIDDNSEQTPAAPAEDQAQPVAPVAGPDPVQFPEPVDHGAAASTAPHSGTGGGGWFEEPTRWVAAGILAVLLIFGIGAAGYAVAQTGGGDGTGQVDRGGDGRDGRGGDGRDGRGGDNDDDDDDNAADEEQLTDDNLAGVTAAVEAEYPGATIEEAETDADGELEAHIVTVDGVELTVELDEDYNITGLEGDR